MQALATAVRPDTSLLPAVTTGVAARLEALLDEEEHRWSSLDADLAGAVNLLREHVLAGGKRLRSAFCRWGHAGAGGYPDEPGVLDVAAALELLHAFALLHDDVMDGSATRRGQPALHRALADRHTRLAWRGDPRRFGDGMAILVGDLAFAYADRLLSGLPRDVKSVWDELRIELVMGQYLDMDAAARGGADLVRARRIAVYKSARYTVERPLHLGAALAGRYDEFAPHYSAFGRPLGE